MIDHCYLCGADVSDLGMQICKNCLLQMEAEKPVRREVNKKNKSAKDKRKEHRRMLKNIVELFKWPLTEKRNYTEVIGKIREKNNKLQWNNIILQSENRRLNDHVERLLEFTELTPEQEKEWCEGKSQSPYWIPVTERLPEKGKYDWVLVKTIVYPEGFSSVPHVAELRGGVWYCDCCDGPMEVVLGVKVVAWFDMEQIKYPKFKK